MPESEGRSVSAEIRARGEALLASEAASSWGALTHQHFL